ncbi:peptide chain release factor N(5)-glutamine methyltransferase [Marinicauda salina]|uniref:peptide chain release factor N(5)-glutamine methyltransferase n=2 Tax=Marinicauda salina TaxID=2135793 RepID=A0A2U2BS90_9PROT|nr:peptide chain release factor N(5)-glutamine methyltransferase [Marinicauda salina]
MSQILGTKAFWTLDLAVTPDVLTPRADTETVVEAALSELASRFANIPPPRPSPRGEGALRRAAQTPDADRPAERSPSPRGEGRGGVGWKNAPVRILDIGTGSGAILLALLSELPNATGIGTDSSPEALAVARENAEACGLAARAELIETDWADGVEGPFDLVVSNPPYIATAVIDALEPEVRDHEPRAALDGGPDGLAAYPGLFDAARALLAPGGAAVFEIGWDQGAQAAALAEAAGAAHIRLQRDLAGRDRALVLSFL